MNKKAEEYTSDILDLVQDETSKDEAEKIRNKMLLAAKIEDALMSSDMNKSMLAEKLKKQPSVITKWLSGTHNFTIETLWDIENILKIDLIEIDKPKQEQSVVYHIRLTGEEHNEEQLDFDSILFQESSENAFNFPKLSHKRKENVNFYQA
jgi:ribosome-binding protein aMBF1 (putative translation factor)